MYSLVLSFALLLCFEILNPQNVSAQSIQAQERVPGQVLVKFKDNTPKGLIDAELKKHNGKAVDQIKEIGTFVVNVPDQAVDKVIAALSRNPNVEYAEENAIANVLDFPLTAPSDEFYSKYQWGLENTGQTIGDQKGSLDADIDAETAWKNATGSIGSEGVRIAVLDTGIDASHPDLDSKIILSKGFTGSETDTYDNFGHGTHVSGIIAAENNNGQGVAGTCPDCRLMVGKVLDDSGSGAYSWIANGIIWASQNGAQVISMSLGGPVKSYTLESAVNTAWKNGAVIVAAAGNSANASNTYPGAYTNVIAVAATDNRDRKASFSSYGKWVDVAAPGVNIYSTFPTHNYVIGKSLNYDFASGTSMATPMAAATAGLIWSSKYGKSNTAVRSRLESTADRISGTGKYWTSGRINAGKAVQ